MEDRWGWLELEDGQIMDGEISKLCQIQFRWQTGPVRKNFNCKQVMF
jgi:hypothetical protein